MPLLWCFYEGRGSAGSSSRVSPVFVRESFCSWGRETRSRERAVRRGSGTGTELSGTEWGTIDMALDRLTVEAEAEDVGDTKGEAEVGGIATAAAEEGLTTIVTAVMATAEGEIEIEIV